MSDLSSRSRVWLQMILYVLFLASCSPSSLQGLPEAASTVTTLPTEQDRIQARISLPRPSRVAFGDRSIWVTDSTEPQLLRLDASTGEIPDEPISLDFVPREIAYGEGAVWVCSVDRTRLARIDPQTNEVAAEIDLRSLRVPEHVYLLLAAGEGAVWLTNQTHVIQIDP